MSIRADITLSIGGNAVALLRSASLSIAADMMDLAPVDDPMWPDFQPVSRSWQATAEMIVPILGSSDDALDALKEAQESRDTVACVLSYGSGVTETGTAIVSSVSKTADLGAVISGSISLIGTGGLT